MSTSHRHTGYGFIPWLCILLFAALQVSAQTNFAVLTSDGAWTWFNDSRALFNNGTFYFGYNRAADGRSVLSALNLQSGLVTNLWNGSLTEEDDHDVPGVVVKQDNSMLAIYSRHQDDQFFTCRLSSSTNPVTPSDWGAEQTNNTGTTVGTGMTYSNPYQLPAEGGRIYNFARYLNYNPNVFTSSDGGATWSTPQILIQTGTGSTRPYVKYCSDNNSRIDILYTDAHPDNFTTSLYHLYYQGGSFFQTDGTFVKSFANLPILHDSGERGTVLYQYNAAAQSDFNQWIATGRAWCWEIGYQTNGNPVCVFQVKVDNVTGPNWFDARIYYYYAAWTGTNWQKRFIAQAGRPLYDGQPDYGGGIALDPQDPKVIYMATDAANPFDLTTVSNVPLAAHYEIWKGVTADGGLTFQWQAITTNSTVDNLRPYVPRRNGGEPCMLWFRGTYVSYTSFATQIVGLFTTAVPQTNAASGTWDIDADGLWSDGTKWQNGIVGSGAGNSANFSALDISANRTVTLDTSRSIGSLRFGDVSGSQNWILNSANGSTLTLDTGLATSPSILVSNTVTINAPLAGTSGLTKSGAGTLILAGTNPLSGALNLDRGIDGNNNDGATRITSTNTIANITSINIRNTSISTAGGTTLQLDGSLGNIVLPQTISATCRNNNTTPTIENLSGTNTIAGANLVQVGGTNFIYQSDAGALLLVAAPIQYVGSLTSGRIFSITGAGNTIVYGPILNSLGTAPITVLKTGTGTTTLNGTNSYANGTAIVGGTLDLNGFLTNGLVNVSGGTLAGSGVIGGPVSVQVAGTISPGNQATVPLTINNVLTNKGIVAITLNKSGANLTNSSIRGVSTFVCGGTLALSNIGTGVLTVGDTFKLFNATDFTGAFASLSPATPGPGLVWNTNNLATTGTLSISLGSVNPHISQFFPTGTNLLLTGSGGAAGFPCSIITSTNLNTPLTSWTLVGSPVCDASGNFRFTNSLSSATTQQFYAVRIP